MKMTQIMEILRRFSLLLAAAALFAVSCEKNDDTYGLPVNIHPDIDDIIEGDSGHMTWHDYYSEIISKAQESNADDGEMVISWASEQLRKTDSLNAAIADSLGRNGDPHDGDIIGFAWHKITYWSKDEKEKDIQLSALVVYPWGLFHDPQPDNLVIGCHVTITDDEECPSNYGNYSASLWTGEFGYDVGQMVCFASPLKTEALVIMPDYQGYGDTKGRIHPYLQQKVTARQVVDGAFNGLEWYTKSLKKKIDDGWGSVSVGYSQGGSVAMAVQRYLEENRLGQYLNFKGSVCGDGPYDPVATLKKYISDDKVYLPVAVALIIKGMCDCDESLKSYSPKDFLTESFIKTKVLKYIEEKEKSTPEIQEELQKYSETHSDFSIQNNDIGNYCAVNQLMRPEVISYFKTGTTSKEYMDKMTCLEKALEKNNLTRGWTPQHTMVVFHSTKDEIVPYNNYTSAKTAFTGSGMFKGRKYMSQTYTHANTGSSFYLFYCRDYVKDIFNGKALNYGDETLEGNVDGKW